MKKLLAATSASAFVLGTILMATSASAQQAPANCPPGSWFCAEVQPPPPPPPPPPQYAPQYAPPQQYQPLPAPLPPPPPPPPPPPRGGTTVYVQQGQQPPPPPVVIYQQPYQQPQPRTYVIVRPQAYAYPAPPPPPVYYAPDWSRDREWGINAHVQGIDIGRGVNGNSGMGGLGASLRYRMVPHFALETSFDFNGGTDYNGNGRTEESWTFNGLVFLNPRSRLQVYLLGGFGWSWAKLGSSQNDFYGSNNVAGTNVASSYSYFGGQAGSGLELRITRGWALNADIRGFVRTRTGVGYSAPEFTNSSGQSTNTSGGAIFTAGTTFYF